MKTEKAAAAFASLTWESEQEEELAQPHVDQKVCAFRPSGSILSENENHDHWQWKVKPHVHNYKMVSDT